MILTPAHKEVLYGFSLNQHTNLKRIRIHNGHSAFEYDIDKETLTKIENINNQLTHNIGTILIFALNLKTATIRLDRILRSVDNRVKNPIKTKDNPEASTSLSLGADGKEIKDNP